MKNGESESAFNGGGKKLKKRKREEPYFLVTFGLSYERQSSYCYAHSFISTCFLIKFSFSTPFCLGLFTFLFLYFVSLWLFFESNHQFGNFTAVIDNMLTTVCNYLSNNFKILVQDEESCSSIYHLGIFHFIRYS